MSQSDDNMKIAIIKDTTVGHGILGIVFIGAGVLHFISPKFYLAIMPPSLPYHLELVYLSGLLEALGGVGVLIPKYRKWAGVGLMALMLAVYPANIYMAMNPEKFSGIPKWGLYLRLPLQFVIIGLIYWLTIRKKSQ
ncbi:MAG: DoxX family protein [Phototrophicaceae bacterium]